MIFPGHHDLPLLVSDLPLFNTPLRRLAAALRETDHGLNLIDIGANVGDGIPLVDPQPNDTFWLIEGSAEFLPYLRYNIIGDVGVTVIPFYLGAEFRTSQGAEVVESGNAHIQEGDGKVITYETLDRLFPERGSRPNLLKIDVEGHEVRVFSGGSRLLAREQPVVFMEWFPDLLAREGSRNIAPLEQLQAAGFTEAIAYDNHGFMIGQFELSDHLHFEQLAHYASMKDRFYFDLAVFAPRHDELRKAFLVREDRFYQDWIAGRRS